MNVKLPTLDVFYIEFKEESSAIDKNIEKVFDGAREGLMRFINSATLDIIPVYIALSLGKDFVKLKRIIDSKRFNVIDSQEELDKYINAGEYDWVINDRKIKKKQYYIRHPKKDKNRLLYESNAFYSEIEEEQKSELIHYIMSHCSPKIIKIDREEISESENKVKIKKEQSAIDMGAETKKIVGNYYSFSNPNGAPMKEPRDKYYWVEESLRQGINGLTASGSELELKYVVDFTFGVNTSEAKTIGLDLNMMKSFKYSIFIKC